MDYIVFFLQDLYLVVLLMKNLQVFLLKLMDLVLTYVQLTPEYHMSVTNPVLYLLDMQHVQRILLGLTFLKHAHLQVSKPACFFYCIHYFGHSGGNILLR